jgi:hypothetical protein
MPQGVPGDISRQAVATVEPQAKNSSLPFPSYGVPGKIVAGKFIPVAAANDGALVYGFLVRPYPTQGANASDPLGTSVPAANALPADILRRGYMTVKCNAGVPALNGAVYVRCIDAAVGQPIGGIEAAADGGDCEVITGAKFMSAADADGNVEIAYNI